MKTKKIVLIPVLLYILVVILASCEKEVKVTGKPSPLVSVEDVRALYKDSPHTITTEDLTGANYISGIVISDPANGNAPDGLVIMQSYRRKQLRGIALALGADAAQYNAGDSIVVKITGGTLDRVNGTLQISGISEVTKVSSNNPQKVNLATTTFTGLINNMKTYESTLVQLKSAIVANPETGLTYAGDVDISDWSNIVTLHTAASASFASEVLPDMGDYTGIPIFQTVGSETKLVLLLRSIDDVVGQTLEPHHPDQLYANFPETWENGIPPLKTGNAGTSALFPTGEWLMTNMYPIKSNNITVSKHGTYTVMIAANQETSLTMNFNLPYGASKFSFYYGAPVPGSDNKDLPNRLIAEYSQDSGTTWTALGPELQVTDVNTFYYQEYILDIKGPVRFRIHKLKTGDRLSIDDIAVYQN
ncbi:hypothetical protein FW774_18915 [Pedobacter sp. BS3]|uniref:DUF5689 domain-containing protein n=1 Tax=Pedobacter sp. BS3 TaxID=2567937 RepID=UPI0011ECF465|nr:DUF5689 domain-containing protein [Pedobacter sp. BS3]TZF81346.1 hypothetical protein FW774_18915 [Pedobacter sp. BS3]